MEIAVLTIFPLMFTGPLQASMLKRAQEKGVVEIKVVDLRDYTQDKHRSVDDCPYGGGPGMVMRPEPIFSAVEAFRRPESHVILMSPQGELFSQAKAKELAQEKHLILICGHYEGVDERVREHLIDREISIGDYVLTGGELPALVLIDVVVRLLPGVLGKEASLSEESFSSGLLEYPQYTRPREFRGYRVPEVLVSGNHAEIQRWRRQQALLRTWQRRPDLLAKQKLTSEDEAFLVEITRGNSPQKSYS